MPKTDEFFREDEWVEELYQAYLAKEREREREAREEPWRPAMRAFIENGCPLPKIRSSADLRACALWRYCDGREFRADNGYEACVECPYGPKNMAIFIELADVIKELRLNWCCHREG